MSEFGAEHAALIESLRGGLIVSCQAYPGEPMRDPAVMTAIAEAAANGGAVAIRAQGLDDIAMIHERVPLPQIGLWKVEGHPVFITPTLAHALDVYASGAEIVAIDGTRRPRPDGLTLADTIAGLHERGALVMADAASLEDGLAAADAGADLIGTTLAGYVEPALERDGPALGLVAALAARVSVPVLAEGRIRTPEQAQAALAAGAHAVVVGTAITHPTTITSWFVRALGERQRPPS